MKTRNKPRTIWLTLKLASYGSYLDFAYELEAILARKPPRVRIDLIGSGEMPADSALLIRSILLERSRRTHVIMNARSSLRGAAVLVWLLGDRRLTRGDARVFFRAAGAFEAGAEKKAWTERGPFDDDELEEADYVRVLELINEFLPVKELAGRPIDPAILKQFGLVDHEQVDHFLAAAFRREDSPGERRRRKIANPCPANPAQPRRTRTLADGGASLRPRL